MTTPNKTEMKGLHRTDILSKPQTDIIRTWSRQLNGKEPPANNKWIVKQHKTIYDTIINRKTNPYSINSRKTHLSVLAKVMRLENNNDLQNPLFLKYSLLSTELAKLIEEENNKQTLTPDQEKKWMSYEQLKTLVMDKYNKMYSGGVADMYSGLIAELYVAHPPVRIDYGNVIIWKKKTKIPKNDKNYMVRDKNGNWCVYLRTYKMAWKSGDAVIEFNKELTKVIDDSLEYLPRKYLLTSVQNTDEPLGNSALQKKITNLFGCSVNTIRKIYASYYFKKWGGKKSKLMVLAEQMLHDPSTMYDYYLKYVEGDVGFAENEDAPESSRQAQERTTAKKVSTQTGKEIATQTDKERLLGDAKFTPVAYSSAYKKAHPDKAREDSRKYFQKNKEQVLRAKMIRNLNNGMTSTPTQASITKYSLRKVNNRWV